VGSGEKPAPYATDKLQSMLEEIRSEADRPRGQESLSGGVSGHGTALVHCRRAPRIGNNAMKRLKQLMQAFP
jgi:hypothetical protein